MEHGTRSKYVHDKCRCKACRAANTRSVWEARQRRIARLKADPTIVEHGRASTYNNWGCRCRPCTDANTKTFKDWLERRVMALVKEREAK